MAFHNNPKIVTDGMVLCADANASLSYPDAYNINEGWQDYNSQQAHYRVLAKDSVELIDTSADWIGYFNCNIDSATDWAVMFDYVAESGTPTFYLDNDGVDNNEYNNTIVASTTKQSFSLVHNMSTTGNIRFYIRLASVGAGNVTISNFRFSRNVWANLMSAPLFPNLQDTDANFTLYNGPTIKNWGLNAPRYFAFDDTDDHGRTVDTMVPTANDTPLTLEAWAMTVDGGSGWQTVLGIHGTYTQIGFYNSTFRSGRNGGGGNSFLSSVSISVNVWYHMALTINSAKTGIAYLDGVQVATGSVGTGTGTNGRFNLASYNGTGAEVLDGNIGAVRAYQRELSAAEISQNFNAQRSMYGK